MLQLEDPGQRPGGILDQRDDPLIVHPDRTYDGEAAQWLGSSYIRSRDHREPCKAWVLGPDRYHHALLLDATLQQLQQGGLVIERPQQLPHLARIRKLGLLKRLHAAIDVHLDGIRTPRDGLAQ